MRVFSPFALICSVLFLFILLPSCKDYDNEYKPAATGRIDEIMLVSNNKYWKGDLGVALKSVLRKDYPGLPQSEPYFDVNYIPFKVMTKLFQKASTIVFAAPLDEPGDLRDFIVSYRDRVAETKNLDGRKYFVLKDLWAEPQQVIFLYGDTRAELIEYLNSDPKPLVRAIQRTENAKALRNVMAAGTQLDFVGNLKEKLGVELEIPRTFREVLVDDGVAWYRQDLEGAIENIMIQTVPISSAGSFDNNLPINLRNSLGKMVTSENENSAMVTDTNIGVMHKRTKVNGMSAIESRGLWKMNGDFMGGPFINYCIKDEQNDRYVMLDMFAYAPQFKKRRYIRRMEAFLPTVILNP